MQDNKQLDGQLSHNLDQCLVKLAEVLKAIGVDEFVVEDDAHYHRVASDHPADAMVAQRFCMLVENMYAEIIPTDQQQ